MNEPARRIRVAGIEPVVESSEIDYRKKLHTFLNSMEAKTHGKEQFTKFDTKMNQNFP